MTQEELIEMAKEAEIKTGGLLFRGSLGDLQKFADLVAAAEREVCAKLCENIAYRAPVTHGYEYAAAIREKQT